jgi:hypothetical protein
MNIKIFLLCPVPENQKPINEYINLQQNALTQWLLFSNKENEKIFLSLYFFVFFIFFGLNSPKFAFINILQSILISSFLTNVITLFFFFFQFFRWSQLENRFNQSRLFYEEGSWYDGQIWEKPFLLIKNERFLTSQKIRPLIQRLSRKILNFFYFTILLICFLYAIISAS